MIAWSPRAADKRRRTPRTPEARARLNDDDDERDDDDEGDDDVRANVTRPTTAIRRR